MLFFTPMINKKYLVTVTFLHLALSGFLFASQEIKSSPFPVTYFQLENGLNVILSEDYSLPVVSVLVAYKVGSINEQPGKTGLSYLLENLMFQGSRNVGRMQHITFIQRIGGTLSARTDREKTMFSQTVSSNQMAIVLWLEADRMKSLSISYTKVEQAKKAIIEEMKQKKSHNLFQNSSLLFDKLLFSDYIYYHPIIGEESDIRNISLKDVFDFYSTYYRPNNAVICITGNIDKQKTIYLIRKYFQSIPAGKPVPAINHSSQTHELTSKTESITNPLVSTPGFFLGYRISPPYSRDYYTMSVIEYLLLKGESSRLYQRLAKKERTAHKIEGGIKKIKSQARFTFFVTSTNNYTRNRSKKAVLSELNKLKSNIVSENELTKAKNLLKTAYIKRYSTSLGKAFFLIETFLNNKDMQTSQDELNKYLEVTPTRIIGIANRYFNDKSILVNIEIK